MSDTFKGLWEEAISTPDFPMRNIDDLQYCFFCGSGGTMHSDKYVKDLSLHKPDCIYVRLKKLLAESAK